MARCVRSYILPLLFAVSVLSVLYISWTDILSATLPVFSRNVSRFSTVPPTTESRTTTEPPDLTPIPILHRKDFKKLPEWDFDDQYRTDRERHKTTQKCDSGLWMKINSDPELRDKFIPNIRMYVHNESITMSEWNRLSHFNNPFGFMDYNYQDVMKGLSLVQKPREPLLPPKPGRDCITCAVVGTGGVLWRSKKGHEIDSHDYVFRVNGAATNGFEDDVGQRTDVYVHTAHAITTSEYILKKYNYTGAPCDQEIKYVLIPEGMRDFEWLYGLYKHERLTSGSYKGRRPWTQYKGQFNETRFYVLHMDFLRYVRNRFIKSPTLNAGYWGIVRPTNGAFMMFLALQLCDRVDAYGFITKDHKKYSNYYYERGANTHVVFFSNHNYNMEMELWKRLHDLDIIHLYLGEPREDKAPTQAPKATQRPLKAASPKAAPPKATPPKAAPPKATPPKAAPPKATPPKAAPPKATPPKAAPPKATPPKATPPKAAPPKATPPKATPPKDVPPKAAPQKATPSKA